MDTVLMHQKSWRPQYHPAAGEAGRPGAYVSLYASRFSTAATYIIFQNTKTNEKHLLQTLQERVINGKKVTVIEPPSGFFNGPFDETKLPHVVVENAERKIETQFQMGKPIRFSDAYNETRQKLQSNQLTLGKYTVDKNLWQTAGRETKEETGLDLEQLERDPKYKVSKSIIGDIEVPSTYMSIREVVIQGETIPPLAALDGDEVLHASWVALKDFDLSNNTVKTANGILPIKPEVLDFTRMVVEQQRGNSNSKLQLFIS